MDTVPTLTLFLSALFYGANANLTPPPTDFIAINGSVATFNCTSNAAVMAIAWYNDPTCGFATSCPLQNTVYNGFDQPSGAFTQFTVDESDVSGHTRNLIDWTTQYADAGDYVCYEQNSPHGRGQAKLIVLSSTLQCLGKTSTAADCSVQYSGSADLSVTFFDADGVHVNGTIINTTSTSTNPTTVTYSLSEATATPTRCAITASTSSTNRTINSACAPPPPGNLNCTIVNCTNSTIARRSQQAVIGISSGHSAGALVATAGVIVMLVTGNTNLEARADVYSLVAHITFTCLSAGEWIPAAIAASQNESIVICYVTCTYVTTQFQAWFTGVLVISLVTFVYGAVTIGLSAAICLGSNLPGPKILLASSIINAVCSSAILPWSIVDGEIFNQNSSDQFWTWQIFLIVFLVSLACGVIVLVLSIKGIFNR